MEPQIQVFSAELLWLLVPTIATRNGIPAHDCVGRWLRWVWGCTLDLLTVPKWECVPPKRQSLPNRTMLRRQRPGWGVKSPRRNWVYAGGNVEEYSQEAPCLAGGVGC